MVPTHMIPVFVLHVAATVTSLHETKNIRVCVVLGDVHHLWLWMMFMCGCNHALISTISEITQALEFLFASCGHFAIVTKQGRIFRHSSVTYVSISVTD